MMDLRCHLTRIGALPTLTLDGEVDLASLPALHSALGRLLAEAADTADRDVAVDVDGVEVLDDAGLGLLLGAAARARRQGGDLVVVCTSPRLLERFELSGFARAVEVRQRLTP